MDFYQVCSRETKNGVIELYPDFIVGRPKDLMVRGKSFYAIWDVDKGLWSTDEYDVQRIVDQELKAKAEENSSFSYNVKYLRSYNSNSWNQFRKFLANISDSYHQLDQELTFANTEVKKSDYVSKRLPYSLEEGDISAWDELVGTLYSIEERAKIEWAIGSIVSGDAKKIQKFLVLYGPAGTGKSTILNIVEKLFTGYTTTFEAKALGSNNGSFATEAFKNNPLVAIQHDGDLSRIEDNTRLNSIISHEEMTMNEKYKPSYTSRVNAFLFMGTNQPVKISDAKSGIIRRLIDVHPTGVKIPSGRYATLISQIDFELGAIAKHCHDVYLTMGKNYYNSYRPLEMMLQTDVFFNFIEAHYDIFKDQNNTTLRQAYALYKEFCNDTGVDRIMPQYKMREELRNYFDDFKERAQVDGHIVRSFYSGFTANKFKSPEEDSTDFSLVLDDTESIFDEIYKDLPAQYAKQDGTPEKRWDDVTTTLSDIDTSKLHYVLVPENHIVIDFDLEDENGERSLERNLRAASSWPATYGELSKSGAGVHLHYIYTGPERARLNSNFSDGIEVKVFSGRSSLRRRLSKCNHVSVGSISTGLPLKEEKVLSADKISSEKGLRDLILRNLRKEIHPGTKSSVDFIHKILDDAYSSDLEYDVTDMRSTIIGFANNSTNQAQQAIKTVLTMKFKSDHIPENEMVSQSEDGKVRVVKPKDDRIVFFDVEVYPNLFLVCWKYQDDPTVVKMINPSATEIEELIQLKLVGFNNRRYDNHILYARMMGYSNEHLYNLSQKIVNGDNNAMFGEAYGLSYADIFDFSSKKASLKRFGVDLGMHHMEMDIPWSEPVPDDKMDAVIEYCTNDVLVTEAAFADRQQDFVARQVLSDLSGLPVNTTTQKHTAKIIFEGDRYPQKEFVYPDLSKEFPGYIYDMGKSYYKDRVTGEGGLVYAEPGSYSNVAVLDVASMHPTTIEVLNLFGPYTKNFADLKAARIAIKHGDYDKARGMLGGIMKPYLKKEEDAKDLSYALKIIINIVYGLTSAKFDNPFRDIRNKDNVVAKRGALFMIDLQDAVVEKGFKIVHIKTDSVKIPDATPEIIDFVVEFGKKYGYDFEHEATYEKFCLVNDAVYIAYDGKKWEAVGAQFQHPYVHKTLFSHEDILDKDLYETKQVMQGVMFLDVDYNSPMGLEKDGLHHVGKTGLFVPVVEGTEGAGVLYRVKEDKQYAVTGTKGYFWVEQEVFTKLKLTREDIDWSYFENLVDSAKKAVEKFTDFEEFTDVQ